MATEWYIPPIDIGIDGDIDYNREYEKFNFREAITNYIKATHMEVKRGDTICLYEPRNRYRNNHLYIWDGTKAIRLDNKVDDYGSVPSQFVVTDTEFSPKYWINTIDHNTYFYLSSSIVERFEFVKEHEYIGTERFTNIVTNVEIGGKTYKVSKYFPYTDVSEEETKIYMKDFKQSLLQKESILCSMTSYDKNEFQIVTF